MNYKLTVCSKCMFWFGVVILWLVKEHFLDFGIFISKLFDFKTGLQKLSQLKYDLPYWRNEELECSLFMNLHLSLFNFLKSVHGSFAISSRKEIPFLTDFPQFIVIKKHLYFISLEEGNGSQERIWTSWGTKN